AAARLRLHHPQRRQRPRRPVRHHPVEPQQIIPRLHPPRPRHHHRRRGARPPRPQHHPHHQRRDPSERQLARPHLQNPRAHRLHLQHHPARSRRHHQHRHTRRRRPRPHPAALAQTRRRDHHHHRQARPAPQPHRSRIAPPGGVVSPRDTPPEVVFISCAPQAKL